MKIYIPQDNTYNKCVVLQSNDVLRVYNKVPSNNVSYQYRDYYIHDNYYFKDGSGTWGNTFQNLPTCYDSELITNNFYYRLDFPNILLMLSIFTLFIVYIPVKLFSKIFRKGVF